MVGNAHVGGSPEDKKSAEFIYNKFKAYDLDSIEIVDYDVYLDFTDNEKFNRFLY